MSDPFYDTTAATHVAPAMRKYLAIEGRRRIDECWKDIWIPTDPVRNVFSELEDRVRASDDTKPRGLVVLGESDTGKSRTLKMFRKRHEPQTEIEREYTHFPVVLIDAPSKISRTAVMHSILEELQAPITLRIEEEPLKRHVIRALKQHQVRLVMIDEFHDITHHALTAEIVSFLTFLKSLVNGIGRPFAVCGTPRLADIIRMDPQIAGRLRDVVTLQQLTDPQFTQTLLTYELLMPLRLPSNLTANEELRVEIFNRSQGYIGQLSNLLKDACKTAIEDGTERLTLQVLSDTPDNSIHAFGR